MWYSMGDKAFVIGFGGVSHNRRAQAGLVCSCPPHDRCLGIVHIQTEMDSELVLCLTGLLWVTGWIPGEALGCIVTRPTVVLDALHTCHYNHRRTSKSTLCWNSSSWIICATICATIYGFKCSPWNIWTNSVTVTVISSCFVYIIYQVQCLT